MPSEPDFTLRGPVSISKQGTLQLVSLFVEGERFLYIWYGILNKQGFEKSNGHCSNCKEHEMGGVCSTRGDYLLVGKAEGERELSEHIDLNMG
jgi:hypothetical protein